MKTNNKINVILLTKYKLVHEYLSQLLQSKNEINLQDFASSQNELLQMASRKKPDVALFCLMEDEFENIEIMPKLFEVSPETRVVVLSPVNAKLNEAKVLRLGAAGIVGAHQKEGVLIRAIRQVSEGEFYLNQRLVAQLLGNNGKKDNGGNDNSDHRGVYEFDPLTNRELEVIEVIAMGLTNKEISKKLFISEATVRHHLSSIYSKLNVGDRLNLVIYAYQHGIVKHVQNNVE